MLKFGIYSFIVIIVFFSCRRNGGDDVANNICNCYDQIHDESVRTENDVELQEKVEICNTMLSSKLASFGHDEEEKAIFMKSFRACQEN